MSIRGAFLPDTIACLYPARADKRAVCTHQSDRSAPAPAPARYSRREGCSCRAADIRAIFNTPDRAQAEAQLRKAVEKYAYSASKHADWLEGNIPDGLTVFSFPGDHWRRIHTVNSLERVCKEIRHRTRVAGIFPNEASCLRLVSALLMEISESWETGKIYLSLERF